MNQDIHKTKKRIEEIIQQAIEKHHLAKLAIKTIKQAYKGKMWLVGGFISDLAAKDMYGLGIKPKDIDLMLAEKIKLNIIPTPPGWERRETNLKGLRFRKEPYEIDIWNLINPQITESAPKKAKITIDTYLKHVPLNIQVLAYDLDTKKIHGDIGIKALLTRTVAINDLTTLIKGSSARGQTIEQYIRRKADKLGFASTFNY